MVNVVQRFETTKITKMETLITILIIIHASFGGFALLAATIAMIAEKGKKLHGKSGLVFYYSMLACGGSAFVISVLPGHENPFLFAVGIFSLFFVITGYRALRFKKKNISLSVDKVIAVVVIISGVLMISLPLILQSQINIVLSVFGAVGIFFSIQDLRLYQTPERLKEKWLIQHLTRMMGGFISAVTAFVVVNQLLPGIVAWLLPGAIGSVVISYWVRKTIKSKTAVQ